MSIWFIKLGIQPERIAKGQPQQNGRLERLHKTLKEDTAQPPASTVRQQQKRLDQWRDCYNHERPHEALDYATPASCYQPSAQPMPGRLPRMTYPAGVWPRPVNRGGDIRWDRGLIDVGSVLAGETCGWAPLDPEERYWQLFYGRLPLAIFDFDHSIWLGAKEERRIAKRYAEAPSWHS